jgi:acetyltransferase
MIELAQYTEDATESLFELFKQWNKTYHFNHEIFTQSLKMLESYKSRIFLAKEERTVVGYIQLTKCLQIGFEPYLEIVQLLVAENRRRTGIGACLMKKAEEIAFSEGIAVIKLESEIQRSSAHVFYEKLGYKLEKVSKFYEKRMDVNTC